MWHTREDGIKVGGEFDILGLLLHKETGLCHAAVFEDFGPEGEGNLGRFRCRVVDPTGRSYDTACHRLLGLRDGYLVPDENVMKTGIPWDGTDKFTVVLPRPKHNKPQEVPNAPA
jgi:hypothetical protein